MDVTEIGNRIKKRRTALEMTQKELAKEMNVSNQLISKWETGESVPSLEYLDALCKALKVDYSYFTSDSGSDEEKPVAVQPSKPKRQRNFKWNWKLFIIIAASVLSAAFIAGFAVLTIYVFVPAANRKRYFEEIETAYENYFELGYYSINVKSELDGDVKDDYRYDGYFDENGGLAFYDTNTNKIVVGNTLTFDHNSDSKYHYIPDKTYATLEDMALDKVNPNGENDEMNIISQDEEKYIRYIRKVKNGYYLEMKDEFFTDDLSGTQKKNYKLTDKIKGRIEIKDGLFSSMKVTVKYLNKPDNEHFTISVSFEFIAEKPVIKHENLEEREWRGTFVGNIWYPPYSSELPNTPVIDTTPQCEELLSTEDFISRLSGGKAKCLTRNFAFNSVVLDGELKDGGDCYYYVNGNNVEIRNKTDLSKKTTVSLSSSSGEVTNVYVYGGKIYYTDYISYTSVSNGYFRVKNIKTGDTKALFSYDRIKTGDIVYNGGYAIYSGYKPDTYTDARNVIDLSREQIIYSYTNLAYVFMDSAGNVYGDELISDNYVPVFYKGTSRTILKGTGFYYAGSNIYTDCDSICTYENDTVYLYEKGVLKETLTTSDPRFKKNYIALSNGYCLNDRFDNGIFDENGKERKFAIFKLKQEDETIYTVKEYDTKKILNVIDGKLIVLLATSSGEYIAVYDETDLSKPLYYMKKPVTYQNFYSDFYEIEIRRIGTNTVIAVRINSVDYYGYDLYYF